MSDEFVTPVVPPPSGADMFHEIRTVEQGRKYILEIVDQVEEARDTCNIIIPGDKAATVRHQQKAYRSWMIRYGQALGALVTLMHCRVLNDVAYMELHERIQRTLQPTIVGRV